jgi:RND superfamily putative drug exporter
MALNLLSTMTSFGTLVFVFQGSLFPPLSYGVIEGFVPALLFAVLFGLSMDYHVLLLSRIQEEVQKGAPTHEAILTGILACYRTITSAALIMACVFLTIACLELPVMKQLGLGLAVAVIIDATIVRTMLLPASMVLLGRLNWYLPRWLEWLPRVKLD